jgi:hypothetical protein
MPRKFWKRKRYFLWCKMDGLEVREKNIVGAALCGCPIKEPAEGLPYVSYNPKPKTHHE